MKHSVAWMTAVAFVAVSQPALRAADQDTEHVTVLPPFLVEEHEVKDWMNHPIWSYAQSGDLEILSACADDETQLFVQGLREQQAELSQFIPDEFLLHTTVPTTIILLPKSLKQTIDEELSRELEKLPAAASAGGRFQPMDDLRLTDPDSSYLFVILDDAAWKMTKRGSEFIFSPTYLRFLIESRAPTLPEWFSTGFTRFYTSLLYPWDRNGFEPDPWLSRDAASMLHHDATAPRPFLPMMELLIQRAPAGKSEEYQRVWEAQAELFVRWALSGRLTDGKERLWRFAAAAASQPVTEKLFQSCFGMDFDDARDALSDYLPRAVWEPLKGPMAPRADPPPIDLRGATPEEVRRIKGEWGRRVLRVVNQYNPVALPLYVEQASRLLQGSYDAGDRDPRLLASLALFRIDTNDKEGARALLEASPAAAESRPLAELELASMRLSDAVHGPAEKHGMISEAQASGVMDCVTASLRQQPPIEGAYVIAAGVSKHLARDPTAEELARLNEGARLFPQNTKLLIEAAAWDLRTGAVSEARRLIETGLWNATDSAERKKLEELESVGPLGTGW
jgi:hypothetical protein